MPKSAPPTPIDVTCSLFAGIRPAVRNVRAYAWSEFVGEVLPELVATRGADKKSLPGFVLAHVEGKRNEENVGALTALVIDVDALPDADLAALIKHASRYTCAVYETPSSTDEAPRVRVIAALAEELATEHVPAARRALAEALGLDPDACGTAGALPASQVMFAGRLKGTRARGLWAYEGKLYEPPRKAGAGRKRTHPRTMREAPSRRGSSEASGAFSFDSPPDLSALVKYVPPAGHDGDRHMLVRALGGWLARRGYAPEAIAEAVALQVPSSDPAERAAQAQDAAERVREGLDAPGWEALERWAETYAKGPRTLRALERACRDPREPEGFGGAGPDGAVWSEWWALVCPLWDARDAERRVAREAAREITDSSGEAVAAGSEIDGTGLHLHPLSGWPWILQRGNSYWLHAINERTYGHERQTSELEACVARDLAGLVSDEERKPSELRSAWVRPVNVLRATYTARAHTYEPETNTLSLAALRWAPLKATRHAHTDRWLRALFGAGYERAEQWLAAVVALDRPAPCLYLTGGKGLGKSLLADGLAALWSLPSPVDMTEAIADFNEATGECPLVFTDEGFPEGLNFNAFRKMVTEHSRRVNVKDRAKYAVEGCARFMIAANNEDVLRYQKIGTLTAADLDAIADRLLVIACQPDARAAVEALGVDGQRRAAQSEIAEHVLWLASTVALEPSGRMAAQPGGGDRLLASVVATRSGDVLERIRESIGTGELGEQSGVKVPKGRTAREAEVWVNIPRLLATFDGRVTRAVVRECCESFALRATPEQHKTTDGQNLTWRVLSRLRLESAFAKLD